MNKLVIFTALSKCFGYITWAASNAITLVGKVSRETRDKFSQTERYDVEIFHDKEQMDKQFNVSHRKLMETIDSIKVFPKISLIVTRKAEKS